MIKSSNIKTFWVPFFSPLLHIHIAVACINIFLTMVLLSPTCNYCYMLTPEQIAEKLGDRNLKVVAEKTRLNYPTVWRASKFPQWGVAYETVKALSEYFEGE